MQDPATQFEIADPPSDGISSITFNPSDSRFLLATSWDTVRYNNTPPPHESTNVAIGLIVVFSLIDCETLRRRIK